MAEQSIGALWVKEGKKGKYFTGVVELGDRKVKVVVFKNGYKDKENQPDWRIFESKPMEQRSGGAEKRAKEVLGAADFEDDPIPF